MTRIVVFVLFSLSACLSFAVTFNSVDKSGIALQGYDPVSYFNSKEPQKGRPQIQTTYDEAIYLFVSDANKTEFLKNPSKYAPQFGGWCAFAVADSKSKVEVDPKSFLIQDGRLLLFYNGFWGNTRDKWMNTKNKDAKTYLKEADQNWPEVKTKDP